VETGKTMKNGLYILWYAKKALPGMKHSNGKTMPIALGIIKLRYSESINQAVSQLV